MPEVRLFVYGSLLAAEENHGVLEGAPLVAATTTAPLYELYDLGAYPALGRGGEACVRGELYAVPASLLARLDAFEGEGYERAEVLLASGERAQAYFLSGQVPPGTPRVPGGSWRAHDRRARDRS